MALNLSDFKSKLKKALEDIDSANNKDGVEKTTALKNAADNLAIAIDAYIRTAEVTVTALPSEISVVGSATAQANAQPIQLKGGDATHTGGLS